MYKRQPEDSKLVFFYISCDQPGVTVNTATYTGAKNGSVKLGYKLLPAFIADRIQDLTANGNVVQRGVYRQDAIKLWKTAPVFGRGLGGFENGVASVQEMCIRDRSISLILEAATVGVTTVLSAALARERRETALVSLLVSYTRVVSRL